VLSELLSTKSANLAHSCSSSHGRGLALYFCASSNSDSTVCICAFYGCP